MTTTLESPLVLDADVRDFLQQHRTESHFSKFCDLARDCFPDCASWEVGLQSDPDEEGRVQAILCPRIPATVEDAQVHAARLRFNERAVEELPLEVCPLFGLILEFESA